MSISRTTQIKSSSALSFDDAMKKGIARALKILKKVKNRYQEAPEWYWKDPFRFTAGGRKWARP